MTKILLGGVIGGLVIFFWGFVSPCCCRSAKWACPDSQRRRPDRDDNKGGSRGGLYMLPGSGQE